MVKGGDGQCWSKPLGRVDAAHMAAVGMGVWVGGLNPLERTRGGRSSTASDQESLSVQSWSMPGSGWRPDSNVHSISDDDLVGKVVATVSI